MADSPLLSGADRILEDGLSGLSKRQQLIASNIANMDTPGYRALDVPFETALQREMGQGSELPMLRTVAAHMGGTSDQSSLLSTVVSGDAMQADGTGVDVDYEMARLSETTIKYDAVSQLLANKIALLRSAVSDGTK